MKFFFAGTCFVACLAIAPAHAKLVDRVVAVVNNEAVTLFDLDRAAAVNKKKAPAEVLEALIHQKLLEQEIEKSKMEVTDDELARGVANVLAQNRVGIEELQMELSAKGISFDSFKDQIRREVRQGKFIQQTVGANVQITDRDIEFYKNDHPEKKWASADDMQIERDLYNERMSQEINNYLLRLRRKAFVEIRE